MTRDDIIRMAREADIDPHDMSADFTCNLKDMERFAALVASAEREACIVDIQMHIPRAGRQTPEYQRAMRMIERIRARGQE